MTRRLTVLLVALLVVIPHVSHVIRAQNALTIGTTESLVNLDPADAGDVFSWEVLTHLYTGLTRQIPGSLNYELALATSHTVSTDGLTHTFAIRPDAAFSDGTPITARAFADSINRVLAFKGRGSIAVAPYIKSAAANSDGTLAITLITPIPYMEQLLALPPYFPIHPAQLAVNRLNPAPDQLIGNGVYKVGAFEPGKLLMLVADPAWKGTPPAAPTITIRHFDNPADLREALKAGQVNIAWRGLSADDIENATQVQGIKLTNAPGLQTFYVLLDQKDPPYSDPVVRRGMTYLLDREQAVNLGLRGSGIPLYTLVPPELAGAQAASYPKLDADQARSVLEPAGYSKYKRIESQFQTARLIYGELYASAADRLNLGLSRNEAFRIGRMDTEPNTFRDQIERGTFQLMLVGWTPLVPHPDAYLRPLLASKGQLAAGAHYANPTVDKLLDQAAITTDPSAQMALYQQAQTIAAQDIVAIPIWQARQQLLAWDTVSGITIESNYLLRYDSLKQ
ncbi:MAG: hypothetical protein IT324_32610 [Anaerolineae bacterium]|nr:hypothetical protein [Anaerolineae bacterium]